MDPLTHLLAARLLIGRDRATLLTGIAPDLAFYSTYPLWALRRGGVRVVLDGEAWPTPPPWMVQLHRAGHSLPVALGAAMLFRLRRWYWPQRLLGAYLLHLLIDIPTHMRDPWGRAHSGHSPTSPTMVSDRRTLWRMRFSGGAFITDGELARHLLPDQMPNAPYPLEGSDHCLVRWCPCSESCHQRP